MRKAHNLVEVSLIVVLVAAIAIVVFALFNNQKLGLKNAFSSVNLEKIDATKAKEKVTFEMTETAGANALKVLGMSFQDFTGRIQNVSYEDLKAASDNSGKDIFDLANVLIKNLHLNYKPVSANKVNSKTLTALVGAMNASASLPASNSSKADSELYIAKFKKLITSVKPLPVISPVSVKPVVPAKGGEETKNAKSPVPAAVPVEPAKPAKK